MNKIQVLDFDTQLFGFKVGKFMDSRISSEKAAEIIRECKSNNIKCIYADLDINDFVSLGTAVKYGFVISDIRVIFEKDLTNFENNYERKLRDYGIDDIVKDEDLPYLEILSKELSLTSRFEFDNNFPKGSAERLYKLWMVNSINKRVADKTFIAREIKSQNAVGVITCKKNSDYGEIILFVVSKEHKGKGLGTFILNRTFHFFKENSIKKVRVVTQARNIPAQRLYQKNGFLTCATSVLFHLWIK